MRGRMRSASRVTSIPSTVAVPVVGSRRVERILVSVVFPAPFGPSSPKISPRRTSRLTPRSASVRTTSLKRNPLRALNRRVTSRATMTGSDMGRRTSPLDLFNPFRR